MGKNPVAAYEILSYNFVIKHQTIIMKVARYYFINLTESFVSSLFSVKVMSLRTTVSTRAVSLHSQGCQHCDIKKWETPNFIALCAPVRACYEHIWLVQVNKIPNVSVKNRETPGKSVELATLWLTPSRSKTY